ncbi:hypothetical protein TrST_g2198 [Triparma strigata]|uniref:Uncharacterized protein n=1 Tax=Triparma strigata TaxID=1606541 RepID=A0A9W7BNY8_9STRA|nr:hypothetical protein TrST_g2198 [Triparma strigata]
MSKRTSEDLSNAIDVLDPTNKQGEDDEEVLFEGSESDSAADVIPAVGGDDFMYTDDFRRLFVEFVSVDILVAMRWLDRKWHAVVEKKLIEVGDEPLGELIVHGGNDISHEEAVSAARKEKRKQVTKVIFLLNTTKVGKYFFLCNSPDSILVVVDIPEGITSIGDSSFKYCINLKDISFPRSLTSIGRKSFLSCKSLEEVDLLHTNVQELGNQAFSYCTSLRTMKVPDSLQKFGRSVFYECFKLVPSDINVYDQDAVVTYLLSIQ